MRILKPKNGDKLSPLSIVAGKTSDLIIISDTEPTGENRRSIWIKGNSIYKLVNNSYTEIEHATDLTTPFTGVSFRLLKNGKGITIKARQVPVGNFSNYTLPTKYRPSYEVMSLIIYQSAEWSTLLGRATIKTDGTIVISKASSLPATFEDATDGYASFCITYFKT